jgi:pimeloyl-ACP methyl ester carboxylesterase
MARELQARQQPACVDHFYQAAVLAWPCVGYDLLHGKELNQRARDVYHSSLIHLVDTAQQYGRFDPHAGLQIVFPDGPRWVRVEVRGFPWQPLEVDRLIPVGRYSTRDLQRKYCCEGLGIPVVAMRCPRSPREFQGTPQHYAATIVLRPADRQTPGNVFALELIDSTRLDSTTVDGRRVGISRDLTGPLAFVLKEVDRQYLQSFLQPGSTDSNTGLFLIEPRQPGKIPVVFVHGLLSDRYTWANLANEFRVRPDLMDRYQILGFEYSTGGPFLSGAATLRRQLHEFRLVYDPAGKDPSMDHMVLVGHSMGGLVTKLQISRSDDCLWQAVSKLPFDQVLMIDEVRNTLAEAFFFEPVPMVQRVIYMGTPHRGSPWARRPVGRLGARLVEEPQQLQQDHQQLVAGNPHVFSEEFSRRIPTSVDLLRNDSPLLLAMDRLPVLPHVQQHSVIGSWVPMSGVGDSDGVVPVNSAIRKGAVSEKIVTAQHSGLHRSDDGLDELFRILRLHAAALPARTEPPPSPVLPAGDVYN